MGNYPKTRKPISEETREKMRISHLGNKNPHTPETKEKIRLSMLGKNKGKKKSAEEVEKIRQDHLGEKSHFWKGGLVKDIKAYMKKYNKLWIEENRQYKNFINKQRQILKKNVGGSHTIDEWENLKAQYNWTCPCCGKTEPKIKLTEDHIIPITKGGSNNIENIQPLCGQCNSAKHTKIIKYENY